MSSIRDDITQIRTMLEQQQALLVETRFDVKSVQKQLSTLDKAQAEERTKSKEKFDNVSGQIKILWAIVLGAVTGAFAAWFKN